MRILVSGGLIHVFYKFLAINSLCICLLLSLFSTDAAAKSTVASAFRIADTPEHTRFVLETSHPVRYQLLTLQYPSRIVVDIKNTSWQILHAPKTISSTIIQNIRNGVRNGKDLRIVFDLNQDALVKNAFILPPNQQSSYRLVLDLVPFAPSHQPQKPNQVSTPVTPSPAPRPAPEPAAQDALVPQFKSAKGPVPIPKPSTYKPMIILDAGHGGKDSGAIGRAGTYEKHVTLSYVKALKKALLNSGKYRVALTRSTDRYIKLRDRVKIAHQSKGDLFISLHADSHRNRKTRGLSVYTLSERASDKEAAALARKANKAEIISDVDLDQENDEVASILIDLVQRDTKNKSSQFAEILTSELKRDVRLLGNPHRFAGFRVLTAADIPSVLIELGYLSNKTEERNLKSSSYRNKLIHAIARSVDRYFASQQNDIYVANHVP